MIDIEKTVDRYHPLMVKNKKSSNNSDTRSIIERVTNSDPTVHGKYVQWMLNAYANGGINRLEDFSRAGVALTIFHKHKPKMIIKDIQKIKTLGSLEDMVEPFIEKKSKREIKKDALKEVMDKTIVIYDGEHGKIVVPLNVKSSKFWGLGTRWCTAANEDNYFHQYNTKTNRLYVMIDKKGKKYQLHFGSDQFMDAKDYGVQNVKKLTWAFKAMSDYYKDDRRMLLNIARYWAPSLKMVKGKITDNQRDRVLLSNPMAILFMENVPKNIVMETFFALVTDRNESKVKTFIKRYFGGDDIECVFKHLNHGYWFCDYDKVFNCFLDCGKLTIESALEKNLVIPAKFVGRIIENDPFYIVTMAKQGNLSQVHFNNALSMMKSDSDRLKSVEMIERCGRRMLSSDGMSMGKSIVFDGQMLDEILKTFKNT